MLAIGCFGAWLVRAFLGVVFVGNWRGRFLWEIGRAVCWCGGGVGRFLDGGVDCWRVIGRVSFRLTGVARARSRGVWRAFSGVDCFGALDDWRGRDVNRCARFLGA